MSSDSAPRKVPTLSELLDSIPSTSKIDTNIASRTITKNKNRLEKLSYLIVELEHKIEKKVKKNDSKYDDIICKKRAELSDLYEEYDKLIRELETEIKNTTKTNHLNKLLEKATVAVKNKETDEVVLNILFGNQAYPDRYPQEESNEIIEENATQLFPDTVKEITDPIYNEPEYNLNNYYELIIGDNEEVEPTDRDPVEPLSDTNRPNEEIETERDPLEFSDANNEEVEIESDRDLLGFISDTDDEDNNMAPPTIEDWQNFATANTVAISEGLSNLNAVAFKKEIPEFTGELDEGITIDEWFKQADKVAVTANWNDNQKLRFYQDRLTKSAANFNETIPVAFKEPGQYELWKQELMNGFQDASVKNMRKEQFNHLHQRSMERIRDFRKRIDDMYKVAFGEDVANSANIQVIRLKEDKKKEIFLNGLRLDIGSIIWGRLPPNPTFDQAVATATECEQIIDLRRIMEEKNKSTVKETDKLKLIELDDLKQIVKEIANAQLSYTGAEGTINYIQDDKDKNKQSYKSYPNNKEGRQQNSKPNNKQITKTVSVDENDQRENQNIKKETRTCFFCGRRGHIKRECRKYQTYLRGKEIEDREAQLQK